MYGAGENRIEYRLYIRLRAADDTQDVAGRGLRVERRGQLTVARLQFGEQAYILDGDDRLPRERLEELDLALRERSRCATGDGHRPNCTCITKERDGDDASIAACAGNDNLLRRD